MKDSVEVLSRYVISKSMFFNLKDGEEVKVKFLGAEEVPNHFDGGKTNLIRYHFEVDNRELLWDRISRDLAEQMKKVKSGEWIYIKRIGEKSKTKYYVRRTEE